MHPGDFGKSSIGPLGGSFKDAIRFWEPRRLAYILSSSRPPPRGSH